MSKFIVVARTTDDSEKNSPIELEMSQPLDTRARAEMFVRDVECDHPELFNLATYRPGRSFEVSIKEIKD